MSYSRYVKKVRTGPNKFHSYIVHPECSICNASDSGGKAIRLVVDKYLITNSVADTTKMLTTTYKMPVTMSQVRSHLEKHSPYLEDIKATVMKTAENMSLAKVESISDTHIEPEDVLQEIITIGGQKIRSGDLPVDGKLLLGALKEQGNRKQQGRLRDLLDDLDKMRFTPALIEGETEELDVK